MSVFRLLISVTVHRIWDARKLNGMPVSLLDAAAQKAAKDKSTRHTLDFDGSVIKDYSQSAAGKGLYRGEWKHNKSASSAYWDPRGRQIVSTSYDDTLRCTFLPISNSGCRSDFRDSMGH
jgi:hypothetical protein